MQKTVHLPQVQYIERIVDVTVVIPHEVPAIQTVEKTVEVPQSQHLDRVVHQPSKVLSFQPSLVSLASVVGPSLAPLGALPFGPLATLPLPLVRALKETVHP